MAAKSWIKTCIQLELYNKIKQLHRR